MKIIILFCIFVLPISCICFAQSNYTESLTVTTYYPSPYGVYGVLKLHPRPKPATCLEGEMTYDNDIATRGLYFCNETSQWQKIGAAGPAGPPGPAGATGATGSCTCTSIPAHTHSILLPIHSYTDSCSSKPSGSITCNVGPAQ